MAEEDEKPIEVKVSRIPGFVWVAAIFIAFLGVFPEARNSLVNIWWGDPNHPDRVEYDFSTYKAMNRAWFGTYQNAERMCAAHNSLFHFPVNYDPNHWWYHYNCLWE